MNISERQLWYRKIYLRSQHWKTIARIAYSVLGRVCKDCGSIRRLHLHHLHYKNLWKENIEKDLVVLCSDCHAKRHGVKSFNQPKTQSKKVSSFKVKRFRKSKK